MSSYTQGGWHNANGGGLPVRRPPTADDALPFSPFTSIMPFSSEIIPIPSAAPPTPPSTLTPDQQKSAKKAVDILNEEIQGNTATQHLSETVSQLQHLLQSDKLPRYIFKTLPGHVTPPPDRADSEINGSTAKSIPPIPALSPFARLLLQKTDVEFTTSTAINEQPPIISNAPSQSHNSAVAQSAPSVVSHQTASASARPGGPAVRITPKAVRRDEYKRYDDFATPESLSRRKENQEDVAILRPHERELADRKSEELHELVDNLIEEKADVDSSDSFYRVTTADAEFSVIRPRAMEILSDKALSVINFGRFSNLPVNLVMDLQSLLNPTIVCATKNDLFADEEGDELKRNLEAARSALQASKLELDTMIEGRDDHRMRREEYIDSVVDLLKLVKDACIIPILRSRPAPREDDSDAKGLHAAAMKQRKEVQAILRLCGSVLTRLATLIGKYHLAERALNSLEFITLEILVEQNNDHEKDSVFTIAKFEQFRQKAMDVIAQIFAEHVEQRPSILNGIFGNLEKLPDRKASARQFKSARGVTIMTMSALFMRFVQVSGTNTNPLAKTQKSGDIPEEESSDYEPGASIESSKRRSSQRNDSSHVARTLTTKSNQVAAHIVNSLVERASNVSKTGDKPFRNLLDLFIEDFCNVLGSPEWPASVILLEKVLARMRGLLPTTSAEKTHSKDSVVDKDMALTTMARIGCGIIDFRNGLKQMKRTLDISQSDVASKLHQLLEDALSDDARENVNAVDLLEFNGPYRMVIESLGEFLDVRPGQEDPHLHSVMGCHVSAWLAKVSDKLEEDGDEKVPQAILEVRQKLDYMIVDRNWLGRTHQFQPVNELQSKLAAGIVTLQSTLCRFLPSIVQITVHYINDKSSKLRSRGMTGLQQLLDKDSRVVGENEIRSITYSLNDSSPLVRESTLSLIATCLERDPTWERYVLQSVLKVTLDPSNGPKKKAIKMLKDIYAGPIAKEKRLHILISLILPTQDPEIAVADLARGVLEDILLPTANVKANVDQNKQKLDQEARASLIIDVVASIKGHSARSEAFEKFFSIALSDKTKGSATNMPICKQIIADMIEEVIGTDSGSDLKLQARTMNALSMFAKVNAKLFTVDQLQMLKLYIKAIANTDDLQLVQPTVVIFRHVFPTLPAHQISFAEEVRVSLMGNLSKLAKISITSSAARDTLIDVAHCLWTITSMPGQKPDQLCTLVSSILCPLRELLDTVDKSAENADLERGLQYLILLGTLGRVCDFDKHAQIFESKLKSKVDNLIKARPGKAASLKDLQNPSSRFRSAKDRKLFASIVLLDSVRPFTMQAWPLNIRKQALQSMGGICQQSPELFMRPEVEQVIKLVLVNDNSELKRIAFSFFNEYFNFAERRSEGAAQVSSGVEATKEVPKGSARLETSFVANANDSATLHLAQKFLEYFVNAALHHEDNVAALSTEMPHNKDNLAVLATNIIASISRQGLVHPKECGAALVALSTSKVEQIAEVASVEHKRIHEKQASYLEKEYMQAIRIAFRYQNEVFQDPHGMFEKTFSPKLAKLFEAMKDGKKTIMRKFIENVCKQIDFELSNLDAHEDPPEPALFARFCLENIALLEFKTLEDLAFFFQALERLVLKTTGPAVALVIETEMPKQTVSSYPPLDSTEGQQHRSLADGNGELLLEDPVTNMHTNMHTEYPNIEDARLRQITTACMILKMIWATRGFVREAYSLTKLNGRISPKQFLVPAIRNNLVSGKKLWDNLAPVMNAFSSREHMFELCYEFADILEVDRDTNAGEEEVEVAVNGYETPGEEDGEDLANSAPSSSRGKKRKSNASLGNTPKKPRGRTSLGKGKKRASRTPDDDEDSE